MAIDLNNTPYYDDFDTEDSFLKILFNPGRAVQARELTQIQSILQNQLSSSADHIWKDGTPVLGGQVGIGPRDYVQLAESNTSWLGRVVRGTTSNAIGIVEKLHDDETQPYYYIRPVSGYFNVQSEGLETYDDVCVDGVDPLTGQCPTNTYFNFSLSESPLVGVVVSAGKALEASIENGIFYTNGSFVPVTKQTVFVDYTGTIANDIVGIQVIEGIKTATDNAKLLDPASGFYNQNAPGADRLHTELKLILKSTVSASGDINAIFIPLLKISEGLSYNLRAEITTYAKIAEELAKRTYDESGDYVTVPFNIDMEEDPDGDPDKYSIKIYPGKAYIKGFEASLDNVISLTGNKGRQVQDISNDRARVDFGPYFEVNSIDDMYGIFDILHKEKVVLFSMEGTSIVDYDGTNYGDGPDNSGQSFALQYGDEKRVTHVTSYAGGFRIYVDTPDGLDDINGATYIRSSDNPLVWAKLHRPKGFAEYKGTFVPWTVEFAPFMSNVVSGQTNYSTQKIFDVEMTGSIMSIPASYPAMHWERVLYVWNTTTDELVPQFGTESTGIGWFADYTGNETLVLSILAQDGSGADPSLSTNNLRIISDMYISNATYRSVNESTYTNQEVIITQDPILGWWNLEGKPGMTEVTSVIGPDGTDYWDSGAGTANGLIGEFFMLSQEMKDTQFKDGIVFWIGDGNPPPGTYTMSFKTRDYGNTNTSNFLCVNSYSDTGIDYSDLNIWQGNHAPYDNFRISDTFDFRVTELDYSIGNYLPLPESYITTSYSFYLPHSDRLTLNSKGNFQIREGFSSKNARLPSEGKDEMTLYYVAVPQYTYDVKNINTTAVDHKQFKMDDIRDIESRIADLEYYTALNLLEISTASLSIKDADGLERYKNGIFVDAFKDHGFGDIGNTEYWIRMESQSGTGANAASSPWNEEHIEFKLNTSDPDSLLVKGVGHGGTAGGSGGTGVSVADDNGVISTYTPKMITLPWTLKEGCVEQLFATQTINLNPYEKIQFMGFLMITPNTDSWFEEKYAPQVVVQDANNAAMIALAQSTGERTPPSSSAISAWVGAQKNAGNATSLQAATAEFNNAAGEVDLGTWDATTLGNAENIANSPAGMIANSAASTGWFSGAGVILLGTAGVSPEQRPEQTWDERIQPEVFKQQGRFRSEWSRQGWQTSTTTTRTWQETVTRREEIADRLLNVSAIPFMRPKTININADMLRPNTDHYVLFDDIDVSSVSRPSGGINGELIRSDSGGRIRGAVFDLPCDGGTRNIAAGGGLRFSTGQKTLKLTDTVIDVDSSSFASTEYTSRGVLNTRQKTIMSVQEIVTREEDTVVFGDVAWRNINRRDPVAQSFWLPSRTGGFIVSIDLYFRTVDTEGLPFALEIRAMQNGYPTMNVLPGARVVMHPQDISISENGTANTRCIFPDLVPLMADTTYCLVVISDSLDYNIWMSELGRRDRATNEYVGSQPYLGSIFTSQNNETWTAEQTRDLKFRVNCAEFDISENGPIKGRFDMLGFPVPKTLIGFQPNFGVVNIEDCTVEYTAKINNGIDALVPDMKIFENKHTILGTETVIDGTQTVEAGYQYTPISVEVALYNDDPNTSPMFNEEFLSAITVDAIKMPQDENATKIEGGVVVSDYNLERTGVYISKNVRFKDPADDIVLYISLQEIPETSFKIFYDTGKVIPKWIEVEMHVNGTSYGDYTINDFEENYAVIYRDDPYQTITGGSAVQGNWNGTVGAFNSSAFIDGDDNPDNDTVGFLTDISSQVNITTGAYLSKYDLEGAQKDTGVFGAYEVDDIWFGVNGDDQDKRFWRKILKTDGTYDAEVVPVLKIISQVETDHPDYHGGGANSSAVIVDPEIVWRKMKDLGQSSDSQFVAQENDFIEHTFVPLKKITKEFDSFRIRIELYTTDPVFVPAMKDLRVLAVT